MVLGWEDAGRGKRGTVLNVFWEWGLWGSVEVLGVLGGCMANEVAVRSGGGSLYIQDSEGFSGVRGQQCLREGSLRSDP